VSDTCAVFSLSAAFAAAPLLGLLKPRNVPRPRSRPPRLLQEFRRQLSAIPEELDQLPNPRAIDSGDLSVSVVLKHSILA